MAIDFYYQLVLDDLDARGLSSLLYTIEIGALGPPLEMGKVFANPLSAHTPTMSAEIKSVSRHPNRKVEYSISITHASSGIHKGQ